MAGFKNVAKVSELSEGEMKLVAIGESTVLLVFVEGQYFAIDNLCTHAWGRLDQGTLRGFEVECPLHGGRFDISTGQPTHGPPTQPITTYAVRVQGDDIFIGPKDDS